VTIVKSQFRVPMSAPDIGPREIALVNEVLSGTSLSIGPFIERFEAAFARFIGARHAIAVSNGTSGLHMCVRAADIGEGDEVITTPFSFVSSANCALYERARPVFVDIDEETLNMDPSRVPAAITSRTRAILPVHVFGQPCAMDDLSAIAQERDLVMIEDACEAVGAAYRGRNVGLFGTAGVFAFYPNKQMTTAEGGMVVTDDDRFAELLRSLRNQGRDEMGTWLRHVRLGFNYRLNELSSALGLGQLERIDELLAKREDVAARYAERLRAIPGIEPLRPVASTTRMSWFVYIVRFAPNVDRDVVMHALEDAGVPSRSYFSPIHLQPFYREQFGYREGDFPVTERAAAKTLAIPFHANLPDEHIEIVADAIRVAVKHATR
jgi:perosamine synthetase